MKTIVIYHHNLFGNNIGSTEKLLQEIGIELSHNYKIIYLYAEQNGNNKPIKIIENKNNNIITKSFIYDKSKSINKPPYRLITNKENNPVEIIISIDPDIVFLATWDTYQWPTTKIPLHIPIIQISPFGHYCHTPNTIRVLVSGKNNTKALLNRGVKRAVNFYNPLETPNKQEKSYNKTIFFGRTGRPDNNTYDSINLIAFSNLEKKYGNRVRMIYANPSPQALKDIETLGIKNIETREWMNEKQLEDFYKETSVFAHARKDGETLGVAIAEAMLHGCPVITHKSIHHNEHLEIVKNGLNGFVTGTDNVSEYTTAMEYFVLEPQQIAIMGEKARKKAIQLFDKKKVFKELSLYVDIGIISKRKIRRRDYFMQKYYVICAFTKSFLIRIIPYKLKAFLLQKITNNKK